jgi:hypothetical protein
VAITSSPKILVLIHADPFKSHRAVEALRIALGLGSNNEGKNLTILLAGRAAHLLAEDTTDIVDAEILEQHLPVFIEWETPFHIAPDAETPSAWMKDCIVKKATAKDIAAFVQGTDRVLSF